MEIMKAIAIAARGIWYEMRCWACEWFGLWSLKLSPPGYLPSYFVAFAGRAARAAVNHSIFPVGVDGDIEPWLSDLAEKHRRAFETEVAAFVANRNQAHSPSRQAATQ